MRNEFITDFLLLYIRCIFLQPVQHVHQLNNTIVQLTLKFPVHLQRPDMCSQPQYTLLQPVP